MKGIVMAPDGGTSTVETTGDPLMTTFMEDDRPVYVQAIGRIEQLERELAECRERVRVERQGYDLATQVAAENARQRAECRKELAAAEAAAQEAMWHIWSKPQYRVLAPETARAVETLKQMGTEALDAALEQARAEERERCARVAEKETHCDDVLTNEVGEMVAKAIRNLE